MPKIQSEKIALTEGERKKNPPAISHRELPVAGFESLPEHHSCQRRSETKSLNSCQNCWHELTAPRQP